MKTWNKWYCVPDSQKFFDSIITTVVWAWYRKRFLFGFVLLLGVYVSDRKDGWRGNKLTNGGRKGGGDEGEGDEYVGLGRSHKRICHVVQWICSLLHISIHTHSFDRFITQINGNQFKFLSSSVWVSAVWCFVYKGPICYGAVCAPIRTFRRSNPGMGLELISEPLFRQRQPASLSQPSRYTRHTPAVVMCGWDGGCYLMYSWVLHDTRGALFAMWVKEYR